MRSSSIGWISFFVFFVLLFYCASVAKRYIGSPLSLVVTLEMLGLIRQMYT